MIDHEVEKRRKGQVAPYISCLLIRSSLMVTAKTAIGVIRLAVPGLVYYTVGELRRKAIGAVHPVVSGLVYDVVGEVLHMATSTIHHRLWPRV